MISHKNAGNSEQLINVRCLPHVVTTFFSLNRHIIFSPALLEYMLIYVKSHMLFLIIRMWFKYMAYFELHCCVWGEDLRQWLLELKYSMQYITVVSSTLTC